MFSACNVNIDMLIRLVGWIWEWKGQRFIRHINFGTCRITGRVWMEGSLNVNLDYKLKMNLELLYKKLYQ